MTQPTVVKHFVDVSCVRQISPKPCASIMITLITLIILIILITCLCFCVSVVYVYVCMYVCMYVYVYMYIGMNDYNTVHIHPESHVSGVIYLDAGGHVNTHTHTHTSLSLSRARSLSFTNIGLL